MVSGRPRSALLEFLRTEQSAGTAMVVAALVAVVWATLSPSGYPEFWATPVTLPLPGLDHFTLKAWVDDGLMTLFFFVAGLEIKREVTVGELSGRRAAAMPVLAAAGGMAVPVLVFVAFTAGDPAIRGWAVPTATDIAFVVGVCALLASRVSASVRLFFLALAIADDIGGILVIALVYAAGVSLPWLLAAAGGVAAILVLRRARVARVWAYVPFGVWIWYAMLLSGVHPTIAGVVVGLLMPVGPFHGGDDVMDLIETRLHPYTSFVIAPVFALANAGVALSAASVEAALQAPVFWGIFAGLVAGKPLGISLASWAGYRAGLTERSTLASIVLASPLGGIGFTVALFIATLSFEDPETLEHALIAILAASITAALASVASLEIGLRRHKP